MSVHNFLTIAFNNQFYLKAVSAERDRYLRGEITAEDTLKIIKSED